MKLPEIVRPLSYLAITLCFSILCIAQNDDDVLRVDTSIVSVAVHVFDQQGRSLTDLKKEDFRIFEDGAVQEIASFGTDNSPITVALMLDVSDSAKFKLNEIQDAAVAFLGKLRPGDTAVVCTFDKNLYCIYDGPASSERAAQTVSGIHSGGGTALYQALHTVASRDLKKHLGKTAIVLLTDGVDVDSKQDWLASLLEMRESAAPVYVIQYGTAGDLDKEQAKTLNAGSISIVTAKGEPIVVAYERATRYLTTLASNSGGRVYGADSAVNLSKHFAEIADELSKIYSIGYYPPENRSKGKIRKIKIELVARNAKLRYRSGYLPGTRTK